MYRFKKAIRCITIAVLFTLLSIFPVYAQYQGSIEALSNVFTIMATEHSITYELNGGTWASEYTAPSQYMSGTAIALPVESDIIYEGYLFAGWFKNADLSGEPVTQIGINETSDVVLYAKWIPDIYTITYNLDGGTISGQETSYTIETPTFTLPTPTREGYTFMGWTGSNGSTAQTSVSVLTGSMGNRSYTANWSCNHSLGVRVTYDASNHYSYCNTCGILLSSAGHSYSASIISNATCTEKGTHRYTCSCGYYYDSADIAALGHDWRTYLDYDATYHRRYCNRCMATTDVGTHTMAWNDNNSQCWYSCTTCGYTSQRYALTLLYDVGAMAVSDWWSYSHQTAATTYRVNIGAGTMLFVSTDYRVDASPFEFNIDFYPDEGGLEKHVTGQTYSQHLSWYAGTLTGTVSYFRLFDNLNTSCSASNRAILENCKIYRMTEVAATSLSLILDANGGEFEDGSSSQQITVQIE